MVVIDRLINQTGDARALLGRSQEPTCLDISDDAWGERLDVIKGIRFREMRLANKEVKVNFVDCGFESCEFVSIKSEAHFWGASNVWRKCVLQAVAIREAISPMNTFENCRFTNFEILNYTPYQSFFSECRFDSCLLSGVRAQVVVNQTKLNPNLSGIDATVMFRRCDFSNVAFRNSAFKGIAFEDCTFNNITAFGCDFSGIHSTTQWWPEQKTDPYTEFLVKLLDVIKKQCGASSAAYVAMENYLIDYKTGRTVSRDFSACLYSGNVPDAQLDCIESEIANLTQQFPF